VDSGRFALSAVKHDFAIMSKAPSMCGQASRRWPKQLTAAHGGRFVMSKDRREYYKQYRQRHKDDDEYKSKERTRVAIYSRNNPDKIKVRTKRYRQNHKIEERRRTAEYRKRNKDNKRYQASRHATSIKYGRSQKGMEKSRERGLRYRRNHPGKDAIRVALRKAITRGAKSEKFTKQEIYERDGGVCHLCGKKCNQSNWHLDHLIPLSLGGEHTKQNVAVACPRCNESKGNRGHSQLRLFG